MDVLSIFIASAFGVAGILLAVFFYFKSRRVKAPLWSIRTINLISDRVQKFPLLSITYGSSAVQNLSLSKVALWNGGTDVIKREDCAPADRLRIEADGEAQILDVALLESNPTSCQASAKLSDDRKRAVLDFDYLDQQNGAVFQVIHTGQTSKAIAVRGTVLGAGNPKLREYSKSGHTTSSKAALPQAKAQSQITLSGVVVMLAIAVGLWVWCIVSRLVEKRMGGQEWTAFGTALFFTVLFIQGILEVRRGLHEPRNLRSFDDDF